MSSPYPSGWSCPSVSIVGLQCEMKKNHDGPHAVTLRWGTPEKPVETRKEGDAP